MTLKLAAKRLALPLVLSLAVSACTSTTQSKVSVDYYSISGNSTAALDQQIRDKGPRIDGGRHAVAVARIKIIPNVRYNTANGLCRVSYSKVAVNARVTLPRWRERGTATKELGEAWDNIDRYTRLHESVHVAIAFRYAKELERTLKELAPHPSCEVLKRRVSQMVASRLDEHDVTQKKFDADEQRKFALLSRKRGA
jgi:predicted secreted Zn-dependent protease